MFSQLKIIYQTRKRHKSKSASVICWPDTSKTMGDFEASSGSTLCKDKTKVKNNDPSTDLLQIGTQFA